MAGSSVSLCRQLSVSTQAAVGVMRAGDQGGPGPLEYAGFTKMIVDQNEIF